MTRNLVHSMSAVLFGMVVGLGQIAACGTGTETPAADRSAAALAACHLDDGTVESDAEIGPCESHEYDKLTVCHVPRGYPGDAHTLCVSNSECPSHVKHHHGDHMGPCKVETPCPTPPTPSTSTPEGTGGAGYCSTKTGYPEGTRGTGGTVGGGSGGATAGKPGPIIIP
jgi:hypothetical protein